MVWQIQCKQHFLKQLYTLNNQLESEETLTWHEDVQMYCWDCMRVRGAMFCCWICMRVYEFLWELLRELLREVLWELLRFCDSSCWRCESCVMQSKYSLIHLRVVWEFFIASLIFSEYIPKQTKHGHDQATDMTTARRIRLWKSSL